MNFFAPMSRYASAGSGALGASQEFKQMVKALHNAGIEVLIFWNENGTKIYLIFLVLLKFELNTGNFGCCL